MKVQEQSSKSHTLKKFDPPQGRLNRNQIEGSKLNLEQSKSHVDHNRGFQSPLWPIEIPITAKGRSKHTSSLLNFYLPILIHCLLFTPNWLLNRSPKALYMVNIYCKQFHILFSPPTNALYKGISSFIVTHTFQRNKVLSCFHCFSSLLCFNFFQLQQFQHFGGSSYRLWRE